jgi:hypothetical protein
MYINGVFVGKIIAIFFLVTTFLVFSAIGGAEEPDVTTNDVFGVESGEVFNVVIYVTCNSYEANYTVIVTTNERFQFIEEASDMDVSGDIARIDYFGVEGETLDFKFPMEAQEDLPGGDYEIPYDVYWMGEETGYIQELVRSGFVSISALGEKEQSPCSSVGFVVLPILSVGTVYCVFKKDGR